MCAHTHSLGLIISSWAAVWNSLHRKIPEKSRHREDGWWTAFVHNSHSSLLHDVHSLKHRPQFEFLFPFLCSAPRFYRPTSACKSVLRSESVVLTGHHEVNMIIGALGILFSPYDTSCFYVWTNVFFFCFFRFYGVVQLKPQYVVQQQLLLEQDMELVLKGTNIMKKLFIISLVGYIY